MPLLLFELMLLPMTVLWFEKILIPALSHSTPLFLIVNALIYTQSAVTFTTFPVPPPSIIVVFLSSPIRFIDLFTTTFSK